MQATLSIWVEGSLVPKVTLLNKLSLVNKGSGDTLRTFVQDLTVKMGTVGSYGNEQTLKLLLASLGFFMRLSYTLKQMFSDFLRLLFDNRHKIIGR